MVCDRAVKRWGEDIKEVIRGRGEVRARDASSKSVTAWEEDAIARKK